MNDFPQNLLIPLGIFLLGGISAYIKAHLQRSPLSKTGAFLEYHRFLKKPVFWSFVAMFVLFVALGFSVNPDKVEVLQKSLMAGLCAAAGCYGIMLWGANLIRRDG